MLVIKTLISFLKDDEYRDLLITTAIIITFGGIIYHYLEGWSWIDSIYFSVITLTTVGYGDFSPQTNGGKLFTIFYIMIGIGIILSFVNTVYNHYSDLKTEKNDQRKKENNK